MGHMPQLFSSLAVPSVPNEQLLLWKESEWLKHMRCLLHETALWVAITKTFHQERAERMISSPANQREGHPSLEGTDS